MTELFAGIDLGTSGCRLVVIDENKCIHSQSAITYTNPDKQTPQLWWDSVSELIKNLSVDIRSTLKSIAVDGTSGTLLLVDSEGRPSSSVLMYHDLRASNEAVIIKKVMPENNGGQGVSGSLARLLWLLKHEANENHAHALHQADFILGKLANNFSLSDENNCLKLGYDVVNQQWLTSELKQLDISQSLLPNVFPIGRSVAIINKEEALRLDLPESVQLVTGTTDSIGAFIATGADKMGDAVTSLGSTLVLKLISDKPIFSSQHGIYSHRFGDRWLVGGASNSGAKVLQEYFSQAQLDEMTFALKSNTPTGLDYYPLIKAGERFPVADTHKQPQLFPRPESDVQFFQGILEGIATIERQGYNKLQELGASKVSSVRSVGGGAKNKKWTQIRKHQLQLEMIEPEQTEAAYGSALLALKGAKQ
ncbi:MAG: FGGY-family carbohydrate kinase [Cocleimonas sp.]